MTYEAIDERRRHAARAPEREGLTPLAALGSPAKRATRGRGAAAR